MMSGGDGDVEVEKAVLQPRESQARASIKEAHGPVHILFCVCNADFAGLKMQLMMVEGRCAHLRSLGETGQ